MAVNRSKIRLGAEKLLPFYLPRSQFGGRSDKRIKYGLQIEGGAADDFERLGCRSLLWQCLVSLASKPRYLRFLARRLTEPRRRIVFGAIPLLRPAVLRRCALVGSPPALDRRRIAAPRLKTRHRCEVRLAHWSMVRHRRAGCDRSLTWVKRVGPAVSACRLHPRLRTYGCDAANRRFGPTASLRVAEKSRKLFAIGPP